MSHYNDGKEVLNDVKKLVESDYGIYKIPKALRTIAAIVVLVIFLNYKFNFGIPFTKINISLWDEMFRYWLDKNTVTACVIWVVYMKFISVILRCIFIHFDKTKDVKSFPVLFTINDLINIMCSIIVLLYAVNLVVEHCNGINNKNNCMSFIAGLYIVVCFCGFLYEKNWSNWYHIHRRYTFYYDMNNQRIPEDATVIYHGESYKVELLDADSGSNDKSKRKEWKLVSRIDPDDKISIKQALQDKEGNLTVEEM